MWVRLVAVGFSVWASGPAGVPDAPSVRAGSHSAEGAGDDDRRRRELPLRQAREHDLDRPIGAELDGRSPGLPAAHPLEVALPVGSEVAAEVLQLREAGSGQLIERHAVDVIRDLNSTPILDGPSGGGRPGMLV